MLGLQGRVRRQMRATKKQAKPGASNAATNLSVAATPAQTVASPAAAASSSETPVNVVWVGVYASHGVVSVRLCVN